MAPASYSFGDDDAAARRLALVARVFDEPSRQFLGEIVDQPPSLALDLGCGPGHTTRLLAEVTGATRVIGLDSSAAFVDEASHGVGPGIEFLRHDVTDVPFPTGPADLIYGRLLLAHLPDAAGLVASWTTQLDAGGVLAIDEVEWIRTTNPVFRRYLVRVEQIIRSSGGELYAGPLVSGLGRTHVREHPVATADAAGMFRLNLGTLVRAGVDDTEVRELADAFDELSSSPATGEITWGLRQVAVDRTQLRSRP